jgi:hypothetical protein
MALTERNEISEPSGRIEPPTARIEPAQSGPAPAAAPATPPDDNGEAASAGARAVQRIRRIGGGQRSGGAQLLATDARVAFLLMNEARKRALIRAFGISPQDANAVTAIGLILAANAAQDRVGRLLRGAAAPTTTDALIAGGSVRALLGVVAGPALDETPGLGTLIAVALAAHAVRPTAARSLHAVRSGSHRTLIGFRHRYGYLVDPGHRRAMRARRRSSSDGEPGSGRPTPTN